MVDWYVTTDWLRQNNTLYPSAEQAIGLHVHYVRLNGMKW